MKAATVRPVDFISNAEEMQLVQNHPQLQLLNTDAQVLELNVLSRAKRIVRSYFEARQSSGYEQDNVPPVAAASLAVSHYCYGWIYAEVTRLPKVDPDSGALTELRSMLSQSVTMCTDLRKIINDWPVGAIHTELWIQYRATLQFYSVLDGAIADLEEEWKTDRV